MRDLESVHEFIQDIQGLQDLIEYCNTKNEYTGVVHCFAAEQKAIIQEKYDIVIDFDVYRKTTGTFIRYKNKEKK